MSDQTSTQAVYRILDASANRAAEGLRTMEEFARFVLEDSLLTAATKAIRHELRVALEKFPAELRLAARAVNSDCGTRLVADDEMRRADLVAVVASAAARTQQALRCLEEYSKTIASPFSSVAESLRYRTYTLAATLMLMPQRRQRLADARLYLLIAGDSDVDRFGQTLGKMYQAGVDIIQLRDKSADDATVYRLSRRGAEVARQHQKVFVVNDRADIAAASGAQGVHIGQEELPVEAVRRVVGPDVMIGVSTHSIEQVRAAVLDGADCIGCGPTFPSQTKSFGEFPGLDFLRQASDETGLPAFAIGGIDESNLAMVMATGIHGVAVSGGILSADQPLEVVARMHRTTREAKTIRITP
ncbi:MAG TPA: thiamine phosphate synthase [Planctomycetaceae bacterium]|nr:thiamine phosphate synthase [Planctomycetaceae bacterium]